MGNIQEAYKMMEQDKKQSDCNERIARLERYNSQIDDLHRFVDKVLKKYESAPPNNYWWTEINGQKMIVWNICQFGGQYNDENTLFLNENGGLIIHRGNYFGNNNEHNLQLKNPQIVDLKKIIDINSHVKSFPLLNNLIETTYLPHIARWINALDDICQYSRQIREEQLIKEVKQQSNYSFIFNSLYFVFCLTVIVVLFNTGHFIFLIMFLLAVILLGMFFSS